jgi:hypothetical protein
MTKYRVLIYGSLLSFLLLFPFLSEEKEKIGSAPRSQSKILNSDGPLDLTEGRSMLAVGDEFWDDRFGPAGVNGTVYAIAVNGPDVYIGGDFTTAGAVTVNRVARWNGTSWSALGSGIDGPVFALAVSGSTLFAGGYFWTAGGVAVNKVAKWDGTSWSALGSGMNDYVLALAVSGSTLYAGGQFTMAGGVIVNCIAKWNGTSWSALGPGMNLIVNTLAVSGETLYAGGWFNMAGGVSANYIARWDGVSWSPLGLGMNWPVFALAVSGSTLYAGGRFSTAGNVSATYIAKWDGSSWSKLDTGMNNYVLALAVSGSTLYAGGQFTMAGGGTANFIAKWDGSSWSALGSGVNNYVRALAVSWANVYAGGDFTQAGGKSSNHFGRWSGETPTRGKKVDFNGDGEEDLLWRYYGPEGYNVVWYMGSSGSGIQAGLQNPQGTGILLGLRRHEGSRIQADLQRSVQRETQVPIRVIDMLRGETPPRVLQDALEAGVLSTRSNWKSVEMKIPAAERVLVDPREIAGEERMQTQAISYLGQDLLYAVKNTNWRIAGTGDFNNDGRIDILWRYNGPEGYNVVWYMNGKTYLGQDLLYAVKNTNWEIAGTGDFNGDGKPDILWRYYGPEGYNVIWYMNGANYAGQDLVIAVTNSSWRIENH